MNKRERILAMGVGAIVAVFLLVFGLRAVLLKPLKQIDSQTAALRSKLKAVENERRAFFAAEDFLKAQARLSFGFEPDEAAANAGRMLSEQIGAAGLDPGAFSRLPVGPRRMRGADEIGWNVQGAGPLPKVVDLLYRLEKGSHLHRIENLSLLRAEDSAQVKVRFRYLTLAIYAAPEMERIPLSAGVKEEALPRQLYGWIQKRNLLHPKAKAASAAPPAPAPVMAAPPGPDPAEYKVVSLSEWRGESEVVVAQNQQTRRYARGDQLLGHTIVAIDYRPMEAPGRPGLKSFSRLILKNDTNYWAVERGATLAQKRPIAREELPPELTEPSE